VASPAAVTSSSMFLMGACEGLALLDPDGGELAQRVRVQRINGLILNDAIDEFKSE